MDTLALPFCCVHLKVPKPTNLPKILKTWGDHIKKRRLEVGLFQKEVARAIDVNECTVTQWELNRTIPQLRFIPRIVEFLKYVPLMGGGQTVGERIVKDRRMRGLSQRAFAEQLGVDPTTLSRIERGIGVISKATIRKIGRLLNEGAEEESARHR